MQASEVVNRIIRQCGLTKDIRCSAMGDPSYRFGWLKSGGKGSQTRKLLSIMSSAAPNTPDVAASGATTQWANGPTAPPLGAPILKQLRKDASMTIGAVDRVLMHVGSLCKKMV